MGSGTRVVVVDYDAGNLHSVAKALQRSGCEVVVADQAAAILAADRLVLPGVGAFADCMRKLSARGLIEPVRAFVRSGRPFLGICVGMQILFDWGEEPALDAPGGVAGLGVLPGRCVRLRPAPEPDGRPRKVPQIGWNALRRVRPGLPLFDGLEEAPYVYFVHSYHCLPADPAVLAATADYGGDVVAAVHRDNVYGVQFHPEKSSRVGLRILSTFVKRCR